MVNMPDKRGCLKLVRPRTGCAFALILASVAIPSFPRSSRAVAPTVNQIDRQTLRESTQIALDQIQSLHQAEPTKFSNVAGTPPGTNVYKNETTTSLALYRPGPSERMADDFQLANGATSLVYYELLVGGIATPPNPPPFFNVHVELWTGDPCANGSSVIQGTQNDFLNVPNNQTGQDLEAVLPSPVSIPATVWMAVTFSGPGAADAGWIIADQAEVGSTANLFSENNATAPIGCNLFTLTNGRYAGFWANISGQLAQPPMGSCCTGTDCTQTTQVLCTAGVWQGAFTTCQPNICLPGACCTGNNFATCANTNQAACQAGIFKPMDACSADVCGPNFKVFEDDFVTAVVVPVAQNQKWADDLTLGPGPPCELAAYDIVVGGVSDPVVNFSVQLELWTNDDNQSPGLESDDVPLAPIPGTAFVATGIPADSLRHTLLVSPTAGVILPDKVWLVMTATNPGGPEFGGIPDIGTSIDGFAIYNHSTHPGQWTPGFQFGTHGFDPTNCPGAQCIPAGSFRADVWCNGYPPTGACCSSASGTCREGVTVPECHGRWVQDALCNNAKFDPPCGASACCFRNPANPTGPLLCQDLTPADCALNEGESAPKETFCAGTTCPRPACIGAAGLCSSAHATPGCEDGFCCEKVCAVDSFCCADHWDSGTTPPGCVQKAQQLCVAVQNNDDCASPRAISGPGIFPFDNRDATTDGPAHLACLGTGEPQIANDVWFCWHSTCAGQVFVRTCDTATTDTKLAVYDGCGCPPTDAGLLKCNDDLCGTQSMVVIDAVSNHDYMIRLGNFPNTLTGTGSISISCGPPNNANCPGLGDCCTAHAANARACSNGDCCKTVCACDSFCCMTEWDINCATHGFEDSGCGAIDLCGGLCHDNCPVGAVNFTNPPGGVVDARIPHSIDDPNQRFGISTIVATGPPGAVSQCWALCETQTAGSPNSITNVSETAGTYTITLAQPITTNAMTTITYTNINNVKTTGEFIAHPANANGVNTAGVQDLIDLVAALKGGALPYGMFSRDINRSGAFTPLDILEEVNLLNGAGAYQVWNNTPRPSGGRTCP